MSNGTRTHDQKPEKVELDLERLVGFASVDKPEVDFRDETFAAKVGAKIGGSENS